MNCSADDEECTEFAFVGSFKREEAQAKWISGLHGIPLLHCCIHQ